MKKVMLLTLAAMVASPAVAKTDKFCDVKAGSKWISLQKARQIASAAGYKKIRMGMEAGCFEAEAEKGGQDYEIYIHPVSGKIVKVRKDID